MGLSGNNWLDICQPRNYAFSPLGVLGYTGNLGLASRNAPASPYLRASPAEFLPCKVITKALSFPYGCFCSKKGEQNQMLWSST